MKYGYLVVDNAFYDSPIAYFDEKDAALRFLKSCPRMCFVKRIPINCDIKYDFDAFEEFVSHDLIFNNSKLQEKICPECGETFVTNNKDDCWCRRCMNDPFCGGARLE